MVRIQLENGYLNVKEGTKLPLNFGVADVRDISKRSGTFSKTITLIGDDNNNNLLNHYYDVNIEAGTFDIDVLTKCSVLQNDIPVIEDAFIQLVSVDKVQYSDGHDEKVEYKVLIKDAQADFFTKIDNSELGDLDFTDLNHTYNSTNIVNSHTHTVTDGYVYPIGANPANIYSITTMRPAIYAQQYWDRIHATNGFSYEWGDISTDKFDLAVIPYNGDFPIVDNASYEVGITKSSFIPTLGSTITSWTELTDDENIFNPTTGEYAVPFYVSGTQSVNCVFSIDFDLNLVNATGADAYLVDTLSTGITQEIEYTAKITVSVNGGAVGTISLPIGNPEEWATTDNPLANGTTTLGTSIATQTAGLSNLLPTDILTFEAIIVSNSSLGAFLEWQNLGGSPVTITEQLDVTALRVNITNSVNTLGFGQDVIVNDFIPKKIKQKDFIKWIIFRWNLYVELDPDNPNKFIYKSRDKYYDEGSEKDWTLKLDKSKSQQLQFLPELSAKKVILADKIDKDSYNEVYLDNLNEIYGQVEFTYDNEYVKGIDKKETIFSPTPMIQTPFNAIVPSINGGAPQTNIRLLLHNGVQDCDAYDILDYGTTGALANTSYPVVSHFDNNNNPTFDLNFGVCDYYFYDDLVLTNNNMYNLFWRRTINQINTGKMLVAYFDLNEADIQTLELSDKIRIDNSWWNINRVIDYNANAHELTKVELLSVDTEIELAPFQTKPFVPTVPPLNPDDELITQYYDDNNNNYSKGKTIIKGINNTILPNVSAYVIGDGGVIDSDGFWLNGVKIGETTPTGGGGVNEYDFKTVSVNYNIDCDTDEIIEAKVSNITLTLPDRTNCVGKKLYIKNYSGGKVTVDTATSSIDGQASVKLKDKESLTVTSDNTRWIIL